jgi:undecaprenyl diphosphate synthase
LPDPTPAAIPRHVAVIMDGNGRWAKSRGLPRVAGHHEGVNSVRELVEAAGEVGVEYLTLYTFSSENWERPKAEVSALMSLLLSTIRKEVDRLHGNNVQVRALGFLDHLPAAPRKGLEEAIARTRDNTGLVLSLALSYGSRQELVHAVNRILADGHTRVDEALVSRYLFTADIPDPDLLIRTGGEYRLSNFLLWQMAYTEIFVCDQPWPEFRRPQFMDALKVYGNRERRFGRTSEQLRP